MAAGSASPSQRLRDLPRERDGSIAVAAGPITALLAAGLLGNVRGDVGSTNVALVLAGVVVIAALTGRTAGLLTAITAAVGYNFFHTVPYHSFRISSGRDVVTVVLLCVIGVIVSEIGAWRRRAQSAAKRRLRGSQTLEETSAMLANGAAPEKCWLAIRAMLIETLGLADCRFEPGVVESVDRLPRSGSLASSSMRFGRHGFELPETGAAIEVAFRDHVFGSIVLVPKSDAGTTIDARQVAVALADQYAVALAMDQRPDQHVSPPVRRSTPG